MSAIGAGTSGGRVTLVIAGVNGCGDRTLHLRLDEVESPVGSDDLRTCPADTRKQPASLVTKKPEPYEDGRSLTVW